MEFKTGKYYKLITIDGQFVIAKFSHSKKHNEIGFIFVTEDGDGIINKDELNGFSKVIPLEFAEVDTPKKKDLYEIASSANEITNFCFSCVMRDDTTYTTFHNDWKPAMLIGEMACATKMVLDSESEKSRRVIK